MTMKYILAAVGEVADEVLYKLEAEGFIVDPHAHFHFQDLFFDSLYKFCLENYKPEKGKPHDLEKIQNWEERLRCHK
jgi:hypothetical protein